MAGYGPKALGVAGRVGDGVVIQLADPEIVEWIMGIARRRAAEDAGRDPAALKPIVCAPAFISDDLQHAREQTRWFPAMVSNHVMDLLQRYPEDELPPALYEYVKRREFYDYKDHSRVGAKHGEFVDDETCDRFSILGPPDAHIEKLRRLEEIGVAHWNIYLMTEGQEQILETYGKEIMPALRSGCPSRGQRPRAGRGQPGGARTVDRATLVDALEQALGRVVGEPLRADLPPLLAGIPEQSRHLGMQVVARDDGQSRARRAPLDLSIRGIAEPCDRVCRRPLRRAHGRAPGRRPAGT